MYYALRGSATATTFETRGLWLYVMVVRETRNLLSVVTDSNCWNVNEHKNWQKKIDFGTSREPVIRQVDRQRSGFDRKIPSDVLIGRNKCVTEWWNLEEKRSIYLSIHFGCQGERLSCLWFIWSQQQRGEARGAPISDPAAENPVKSEWTSN